MATKTNSRKRLGTSRTKRRSAYRHVKSESVRRDASGARVESEAEPAYYTPRRPERPTYGHLARLVASWLGLTLMPWQCLVADVALEYEKTSRGDRFYYDRVSFTVPRQSGKTLLAFVLAIVRGMIAKGVTVGWSAQDYQQAAAKWKNELFVLVNESKVLAGKVKTYETNGAMRLKIHSTNSTIEIVKIGSGRGHGPTRAAHMMDEIYEFVNPRVLDGVNPSLSRIDSQLYMFSTMGDEASALLDSVVQMGRAATVEDSGSHRAHFEWKAPEGWENGAYLDPRTWWGFMPALGHTATERTIGNDLAEAQQFEDGGHEGSVKALFIRPYGNLSDKGRRGWRVIGEKSWRGVARFWTPDTITDDDVPVFALAVDDEGVWSIAVGLGGDRVGLVEQFYDPVGLAERCNHLTDFYGTEIAYDRLGPAAPLFGLEDDSRDLVHHGRPMDSGAVLGAHGALINAIKTGDVSIKPDPLLDASVESAAVRKVGQLKTWQRNSNSSAIEAVTLAFAFSGSPPERRDDGSDLYELGVTII